MTEQTPSPVEPTPLPVLPPAAGTTPAPPLVRSVLHAVNAALDVADDLADAIVRAFDSVRGGRG